MIDRPNLEGVVLAIAKSLYKIEPKITKYSLRDRSVWGLEFDDGRADRVIKLDINRPTSLMREKQVMQILKAEGFAVPEIEFTQEDLPSVWIPFITMPKVADNLTMLKAFDLSPQLLLQACCQTGEFLGRLHQLPVKKMLITPSFLLSAEGFGEDLTASEIDLRQLKNSLNHIRNNEDIPQRKNQILRSLNQLKQIIEGDTRQDVTHRDFAPNQVLVSDLGISAIDWEFAAAGRMYRDLGDFVAALRRITGDDRYVRAFIDSYCSFRALSAEEMAEVGLWEIFSMVRKARLNSLSKKERMAQRLFQLAGEETFASQYQQVS